MIVIAQEKAPSARSKGLYKPDHTNQVAANNRLKDTVRANVGARSKFMANVGSGLG